MSRSGSWWGSWEVNLISNVIVKWKTLGLIMLFGIVMYETAISDDPLDSAVTRATATTSQPAVVASKPPSAKRKNRFHKSANYPRSTPSHTHTTKAKLSQARI